MQFSVAMAARHLGSILLAVITWWSITILVGLLLFQIWPPVLIPVSGNESTNSFSLMLGISLGRNWQNIPANLLGFIGALYAFRALAPEKS